MASGAPTNEDEAQRAAIERELADKWREHRDYLATITGTQYQQHGAERPMSNGSSAATFDSGIVADAPSSRYETSHEQNIPLGIATTSQAPVQQNQTVDLDNQNAEEQQLEPDVRGFPNQGCFALAEQSKDLV